MPIRRKVTKKKATKKRTVRKVAKKKVTKKKSTRGLFRRRAMERVPDLTDDSPYWIGRRRDDPHVGGEHYEDEYISGYKYRDAKPKPLTGAAKDAAQALESTADEAESAISKFLHTLRLHARGGRNAPSKANVLAIYRLAQDYPGYSKRILPRIRAFRKASDALLMEIGDLVLDLEKGVIPRDSIGRGMTKADTRKEYDSTLLGTSRIRARR